MRLNVSRLDILAITGKDQILPYCIWFNQTHPASHSRRSSLLIQLISFKIATQFAFCHITVLLTPTLRGFIGRLWNFRRLKPYFFVLFVYSANKMMSLIKVQAGLYMDVQCESQFLSDRNSWWFNTFNSMKNKTQNSKFLQASALLKTRQSNMVSKIFCKIKHILGAHVKDTNFIREGQPENKNKIRFSISQSSSRLKLQKNMNFY